MKAQWKRTEKSLGLDREMHGVLTGAHDMI